MSLQGRNARIARMPSLAFCAPPSPPFSTIMADGPRAQPSLTRAFDAVNEGFEACLSLIVSTVTPPPTELFSEGAAPHGH